MDRREFLAAGAAASLSLTLGPLASAARLGGTPLALVTADLESHVAVLDLTTAKTVARIRTAPGPRSIEAVLGTSAIVAHTDDGVVSLLGVAPFSVRAEIEGFEAPRYTAVQPPGSVRQRSALAYITDSAAEEVVTVDLGRRKVVWRTRVPGPARHVSISPDGRAVWASLGNAATRVAVLDTSNPRRPRLVRTISTPFLAHDVVFAPDSRSVWMTSGSERRTALYRGERRPSRILVSGASPQHVTFASGRVFVACGDDGVVYQHRPDGERVREAHVPIGSFNVTSDHERVVTPSLGDGRVSILDRTGRVRRIAKVARAAHDACIVVGP